MSTHNICFCREIRKILCGYPFVSVAMFCSRLEVPYFIILIFLKFCMILYSLHVNPCHAE